MTHHTATDRRSVRFGSFELDLDTAELRRRGLPLHLPPQPSSVLVLLVEHAGRLVSHQDIRRRIGWSVDAGQIVHTCVSQLRKALGDPVRNPVYIETVPRRGYRFIAPIHGEAPLPAPAAPLRRSGRMPVLRAAGLLALVLGGVAAGASVKARRGAAGENRPATAPQRPAPASEAARLAYLEGRYLLEEAGPDSLAASVERFLLATALDADYAPAWVGLSRAWAALSSGADSAGDRAVTAAETALRLDPDLADAHLVLGTLLATRRHDQAGAGWHLARAVTLDPRSAEARTAYGMHLTRSGRHREAIAQLEEAMRLDPVSAGIRGDAGMTYFLAGELTRARDHCAVGVRLEPEAVSAQWCLLRTLDRMGLWRDELDVALALMRIAGVPRGSQIPVEALPVRQARDDFWRSQALWFEHQIEGGSRLHYPLAVSYATLGEYDLALDWLERAVAEQAPAALLLNVEPAFETLRSNRRFVELVEAVGLGPGAG